MFFDVDDGVDHFGDGEEEKGLEEANDDKENEATKLFDEVGFRVEELEDGNECGEDKENEGNDFEEAHHRLEERVARNFNMNLLGGGGVFRRVVFGWCGGVDLVRIHVEVVRIYGDKIMVFGQSCKKKSKGGSD